jgi:hypothetical protein
MMELYSRWKKLANEIREDAVACKDEPAAYAAMIGSADVLDKCADELLSSYLTAFD